MEFKFNYKNRFWLAWYFLVFWIFLSYYASMYDDNFILVLLTEILMFICAYFLYDLAKQTEKYLNE